MSTTTFRYRESLLEMALLLLALVVVIWSFYYHYEKSGWSNFDLAFRLFMLLPVWFYIGRGLFYSGATLELTSDALELRTTRWPARGWRIPYQSIEWVGVQKGWPGRTLHLKNSQEQSRRLRLVNWYPANEDQLPKDWDQHPLVTTLQKYCQVKDMNAADVAVTMDLGAEVGRLVIVSAGFILLTLLLFMLHQASPLGDGVPWAAIVVAGFVAWLVALRVLWRARSAGESYVFIPLIFAATFAGLFTVAAQKVLYLAGADVSVEYQLVGESKPGMQRWEAVAGAAPAIEVNYRNARYRRDGASVTLELRRGALGVYFIAGGELNKIRSR